MLVTAISLPSLDIAIFSGRSPKGIELPAGDSDQPLGNKTLAGWATKKQEKNNGNINKKNVNFITQKCW